MDEKDGRGWKDVLPTPIKGKGKEYQMIYLAEKEKSCDTCKWAA